MTTPFYDDTDLALAALRSLVSDRMAVALITVIDALRSDMKQEAIDGSRQAATHDRYRTPGPAGAHAAPGIAALTSAVAGADDTGAGAGEDGLSSVPDRITPVVGWRAWKIVPSTKSAPEPELWSIHVDEHWQPGQPVVAQCDIPKRRHAPLSCTCPPEPAPATNCRCGIYATRELRHLAKYVGDAELSYPEILIVGRVALWGRVVEYEDGWRGQYGYPQALYVPRTVRANAEALQLLDSFDVPVLDAAELEPRGWAPPVTSRAPWSLADVADAPGLDPQVAATPVDYELAARIAGSVMSQSTATRLIHGMRLRDISRLGQALALSESDLGRMHHIGPVTVEKFRAWRIEQGYGDFPQEDQA